MVGEPIRQSVMICNKKGLHARASAAFVKCAGRYDAQVNVVCNDEQVGGTSIMGLMMFAASKGTQIEILVSGPQAQEAIDALVHLVEAGFHEED